VFRWLHDRPAAIGYYDLFPTPEERQLQKKLILSSPEERQPHKKKFQAHTLAICASSSNHLTVCRAFSLTFG
jgi:hypothetical protein